MDKEKFWIIFSVIILIIIAIACTTFYVMLFIKYKDVPVSELPGWVFWLLRNK